MAVPKMVVTTVNGVIPKVNQILLKSPGQNPKKTIPITLSLSGPVQPVSYFQPQNIPETVQVSRTPVTQLLHRTLTQRQALLKHLKQQTVVTSTGW